MKKRVWLLVGGAVVLAAGFWELFHIKEDHFLERGKRITYISPNADGGYWTRIAQEIVETTKADGIDVKCIGFRELDTEKQVKAMEGAIWSGVDGIITAGIEDTPEIKQVIAQAREAGIPVVLVDSDITDSRRNCYVGADNYEAGKSAGRSMAAACAGEGKILVIVSSMENGNQIQRVKGFQDIISENPGMEVTEILEGNSNEIYIQDKLARILETNPDIRGVFCAEGYAMLSMCRLKTDMPEQYGAIHLVGFEGDIHVQEYLKAGIIDTDIQQDTEMMGKQAAEILKRAMEENADYADYYVDIVCLYPEDQEELENYGYGDAIWHVY